MLDVSIEAAQLSIICFIAEKRTLLWKYIGVLELVIEIVGILHKKNSSLSLSDRSSFHLDT